MRGRRGWKETDRQTENEQIREKEKDKSVRLKVQPHVKMVRFQISYYKKKKKKKKKKTRINLYRTEVI